MDDPPRGLVVTHTERVLRLLSDGRWHTHHELYQLHVIAHSRVADLRKQGYRIECEKTGGQYRYRLALREPAEKAAAAGSRSALGEGEPWRALLAEPVSQESRGFVPSGAPSKGGAPSPSPNASSESAPPAPTSAAAAAAGERTRPLVRAGQLNLLEVA